MPATTRRDARRAKGDALDAPLSDVVVVEEPLEIRVAGEPVALTMRTPGDDHLLALGFLFAEGVVSSADEVSSVAPCGRPGEAGYGNVVDVRPGGGVVLDVGRSRRGTLTTSACGLCGRAQIDDLLERIAPVRDRTPLRPELLARAPGRLDGRQATFRKTGAVHAALALSAKGEELGFAEDVGRHNAVDKLVGRLLVDGRVPLTAPAILVVSGRTSFEIVQKAAVARFVAVVSISGATSLAIDVARDAGVTLCAFARDGEMQVYAGGGRLATGREPALGMP